jgi:hypothetical protein
MEHQSCELLSPTTELDRRRMLAVKKGLQNQYAGFQIRADAQARAGENVVEIIDGQS